MFKTTIKMTALIVILTLSGCAATTQKSQPLPDFAEYRNERTLENFQDYVQFLKNKAEGQGVSKATLNAQQQINYVESAIRLDKKQAGDLARRKNQPPTPPNPMGATYYLAKHLNQAKVNKAVQQYSIVQSALNNVARTYGVQPEFILALWGMESSFGHYQGNFDVLSVLATLSFDGRREKLFSQEFINAMKMLDSGHLPRSKMLGSWAGAMGQTQFMPTSYLNYAADGDGDGVKDIWKNQADVFASIANYLHSVGWNPNLPWGVEVSLTQSMDLALSGIEKQKSRSLQAWQQLGIQINPDEVEKLTALSGTELWLVRPDKEVGRVFLVTNNFRTILDWNRSNYYALSVGIFADRIKAALGL
ncbi:MAG: lytic murein transglycosylase [Lonepinella koalarum]|nr:lytic murein transglycosylase [Lonepinella koalarum]